MEGVWDHLGLGSGLGRESDGMMMRMCDYDRLRYDDRDRPGTATPACPSSFLRPFLQLLSEPALVCIYPVPIEGSVQEREVDDVSRGLLRFCPTTHCELWWRNVGF